jgi:hypothetical protein
VQLASAVSIPYCSQQAISLSLSSVSVLYFSDVALEPQEACTQQDLSL